MELDSIQALGSSEDSQGDGAELLRGPQKQSSLKGPSCDLDDSTAFRDEPDGSGHGGVPENQGLCQPWSLSVVFSEVQARKGLMGLPGESLFPETVKRFRQLGDRLQV
jgi:hypothetical protein